MFITTAELSIGSTQEAADMNTAEWKRLNILKKKNKMNLLDLLLNICCNKTRYTCLSGVLFVLLHNLSFCHHANMIVISILFCLFSSFETAMDNTLRMVIRSQFSPANMDDKSGYISGEGDGA